MNEKTKKAVMAPVIALAILVVVFGIILGLQSVGIGCGWIVLFTLTAYLMSEKGPSKAGLAPCVCGGAIGILGGQLFTIAMPAFALFALVLLACKVGGWLKPVMNEYTLLYMTVYTIPGVCNPSLVWQDLLVFGVFCAVMMIAVLAIDKKMQSSLG